MNTRSRLTWAAAGLAAAALLVACESEATVTIGPDAQPTNVSARLEVPKAALGILGIDDLSEFEEALRSDIDEADLPAGATVDFLEEDGNFVFTATTPVTTTDEALQAINSADAAPWTWQSSTDSGVSVTLTRAASEAAEAGNPLGEDFEVRQYLTLVMPGPIESATSDGPPPAIEGNSARFTLTPETTQVTAVSATSGGPGALLWILIAAGAVVLAAVIGVIVAVTVRRNRASAEPVGIEPGATEPGATEPEVSEPGTSEPSDTGPEGDADRGSPAG